MNKFCSRHSKKNSSNKRTLQIQHLSVYNENFMDDRLLRLVLNSHCQYTSIPWDYNYSLGPQYIYFFHYYNYLSIQLRCFLLQIFSFKNKMKQKRKEPKRIKFINKRLTNRLGTQLKRIWKGQIYSSNCFVRLKNTPQQQKIELVCSKNTVKQHPVQVNLWLKIELVR